MQHYLRLIATLTKRSRSAAFEAVTGVHYTEESGDTAQRGGAIALAQAAASCSKAPEPATLLVTLGRGAAQDRAPEDEAYADMIVHVELEQAATPPSRRTLDAFAAVGVPSVWYDGRRALVAAHRSAADPMQVWEVFVDRFGSASGGLRWR